MSLFDFWKKQNTRVAPEINEPAEEPTQKTFLDEAEYAAERIQNNIENGDYANIEKDIREIVHPEHKHARYVFPPYNYVPGTFSRIVKWLIFAAALYIVLISASLIVYGGDKRPLGFAGILVCLVVFVIDLLRLRRRKVNKLFSERYRSYAYILKYRQIEFIDDLAEMTQNQRQVVVKDLKKAVKEKLIPEGHFAFNDNIFMVSDVLYEDYLRRPLVYNKYYADRFDERQGEKNSEIAEVLRRGNEYVDSIRVSNSLIKEEEMSKKLDRLEHNVEAIFHEVQVNPKQAKKLNLFMSYYLPTTEKLLQAYIDIDSKHFTGENARKTRGEILHAIDVINVAYENLLQKFYDEQAFEISVEVSALESVMKQKGLA